MLGASGEVAVARKEYPRLTSHFLFRLLSLRRGRGLFRSEITFNARNSSGRVIIFDLSSDGMPFNYYLFIPLLKGWKVGRLAGVGRKIDGFLSVFGGMHLGCICMTR